MKKLLSLILAGSMLFSFAACGGSSESKDDDSNKKNSSDIVENNGGVGEENDGFVADKDDSDADFSDTQVGEYITFGSYEQDNDLSNGKEPIEWLVLDKQDGRILIISKYGLDGTNYNDKWEEVTWENCTLRQWLNDYFINNAFNDSQNERIVATRVVAEDNTVYGTEAGNDTVDKVFLLSISEVEKYFSVETSRGCVPTTYSLTQGVWKNSDNDYCCWRLRTPAEHATYTCHVTGTGYINQDHYSGDSYAAVRPAMWIEL